MTASYSTITDKKKTVYANQGAEWNALAALAQGGDKKAYADLLRSILPSIQRALAGKVKNPDWIDDITQEVLMSVHKSFHTYSTDRPFRPWLMAIVNFRRMDYLRGYYRRKDQSLSDGEGEDYEDLFVTEAGVTGELKDIEKLLDALSDKQRKIFQMTRIEGYSIKETAAKMDMSESAVKVSVHRTTKRLQAQVQQQREEAS